MTSWHCKLELVSLFSKTAWVAKFQANPLASTESRPARHRPPLSDFPEYPSPVKYIWYYDPKGCCSEVLSQMLCMGLTILHLPLKREVVCKHLVSNVDQDWVHSWKEAQVMPSEWAGMGLFQSKQAEVCQAYKRDWHQDNNSYFNLPQRCYTPFSNTEGYWSLEGFSPPKHLLKEIQITSVLNWKHNQISMLQLY